MGSFLMGRFHGDVILLLFCLILKNARDGLSYTDHGFVGHLV